jgi:DNA-binding PadR family transcriptional regulator
VDSSRSAAGRGNAPREGAAHQLDARARRPTDRGALYKTLDRLEAKGFVAWTVEAGGPARGGHRRRLFSVTPEGVDALRRSRGALLNLWEGLEPLLGGRIP